MDPCTMYLRSMIICGSPQLVHVHVTALQRGIVAITFVQMHMNMVHIFVYCTLYDNT